MKAAAFEKELMNDLCRYIERHQDEPINLKLLAGQAQLSPAHLQRRFKALIGLSPKEYADSCRLRKLKSGLRQAPSVAAAVYDAGFSASSRVYEKADAELGMTPGQYRAKGAGMAISYASAETPLGLLLMAATDRGLCFMALGESEEAMLGELKRDFAEAEISPMRETHREQFNAWMRALSEYLKGSCTLPELPLDIRGTAFQRKVWKYLQTIPRGRTETYKQVAEGIGALNAVRAVAGACARNHIAIVIPCHRVIRGNGELSGYRWGIERKRRLIEGEKVILGGAKAPSGDSG